MTAPSILEVGTWATQMICSCGLGFSMPRISVWDLSSRKMQGKYLPGTPKLVATDSILPLFTSPAMAWENGKPFPLEIFRQALVKDLFWVPDLVWVKAQKQYPPYEEAVWAFYPTRQVLKQVFLEALD